MATQSPERGSLQNLAEHLARQWKEDEDRGRVLAAQMQSLPEPMRVAAEERALADREHVMREKGVLEVIQALYGIAIEAAEASAEREKLLAAREDRMLDRTEKLLTLTIVLAVVAALTLVANILQLAHVL